VSFERHLVGTLLERGTITAADVERAAARAEERDLRLTEALTELHLVDATALLELTAERLGLSFLPRIDVEAVEVELTLELRSTFAKEQKLLPLWHRGNTIQVAISDPLSLDALDALRLLFDCPIEPVVVPELQLIDAINKVFDRRAGTAKVLEGMEEEVLNVGDSPDEINYDLIDIDGDDEAPIIKLVNSILSQAVRDRASDIHIEPFERHIAVRFRVDGMLNEIAQPPRRFHSSVAARIKVMADLDIAEKRVPQDGRIKLKVAGKDIDIRVSTLPTSHGERIVMRLLDKTAVLKDLAHIGMGASVLDNMNEMLTRSYGIILVTGPTGSGKTTTLYAGLAKINSPGRNIITVEDPVEYQLSGIGQTQVNTKVGLTFAAGLRSILRQDPDVVMIGEIRDKDTAEIAIQASLTGHLVFSTLHTNDAAGAVSRLVDMKVEPFLVASSVIGIMAQRLVRTLCKNCRQPVVPTEAELRQLGYTRDEFMAISDGHVYQGAGCSECLDTGFKGRTGIYEMLVVDDDIRPLIMDNVDSNTIKKTAIKKGMTTLRDDGVRKVLLGTTSISEVLRVTQDDLIDLE
jgi:general secretion pathway protein E